MPTMQIEIYNRLVDVELNEEGEVLGYSYYGTNEPVYYLHEPNIQNAIDDFMELWYHEIEDYKRSRGRDRLDE